MVNGIAYVLKIIDLDLLEVASLPMSSTGIEKRGNSTQKMVVREKSCIPSIDSSRSDKRESRATVKEAYGRLLSEALKGIEAMSTSA